MGFALEEVNFALATMESTVDDRKWSSVKAFATQVGLIGIDGVELGVENLNVEMNVAEDGSDVVADFSENPLVIGAGLEYDISLDFDGAMGPIVIAEGEAKFRIGDFLTASGKIAFATRKEVIHLSDQSAIDANIMTLAGTDIGGFAGFGNDESPEESMGFSLNDIDFGMAYIKPSDIADERSWVAFDGSAGYMVFKDPLI
ncbi:MAG: hypothetical protein OMM_04731 [Candidatus Magnetoglobus multicellularis str. Araruama]|uniref:Uncharacterized protein n=1 Tax=Candidatus Magnetoglobus multicellularis str. Araruama TaxID=890399 RepID=A0A1V1P035_9BACT|nr:MAG: hypothetical protein OMM_04731 [Candidatus Magnetoglobus multicellularis str. Araruama]